ncbi:hypothetical protein HDU76_001813 [Blyttiomyces sp. JEL0837]|nr:hypothetical protein HDU76_001813 [Blyttiomyces sp. JEL0837]
MMRNPKTKQKELAELAPPLQRSQYFVLDRYSKFIAHTAAITSKVDLDRVVAKIKTEPELKNATHNILAWRYLALKKNTTGLNQSDFFVVEGCDDDGEQWAGGKLLRLMQAAGAADCLLVVTRWYGGTMLGPVRFKHIENIGLAALKEGGYVDLSDQDMRKLTSSISSQAGASSLSTTNSNQPKNTNTNANSNSNTNTAGSGTLNLPNQAPANSISSQTPLTLPDNATRKSNSETIASLRGKDPASPAKSKTSQPSQPSSSNGVFGSTENPYTSLGMAEAQKLLAEKDGQVEEMKREITKIKDEITVQEKAIENLSFKVARRGEF